MNRLLRAVDENEKFYNVDNYRNNTPSELVQTYIEMQEEAFRIQKNMHIIAKDLQLLDLSKRDIKEILVEAGVNKDLAKSIIKGKFVPVNYSEPRFNTKVETIEGQLKKIDGKFKYKLNEDFVFPERQLDRIKRSFKKKRFFERGDEYEPGEKDYKLDKKGNLLKDDKGNPIIEEGFIKESLRKLTPIVKEKIQDFTNDYESNIQTPPLPNMPQPKVQTARAVNPNTNLTRTQEALLSPDEKVIASKRTV
jgi:hypothetical protein